MRSRYIGLIIIGIGVVAFGCTPKEDAAPEQKGAPAPTPEATEAAAEDPTAEAAEIFESRCTVCHGITGKGDGEGSAALDPKPRDFTSPEWQKSVTDDHIQKIIVYGGLGVGKSPTMPANPDLDAKPAVVKELVAYVRDLAK
jgi:cytochrome c oxidase cbb3-type subunit 2/cytochrome c oxidase cbb3-type subunit I/II